jgi:hypothetical protein
MNARTELLGEVRDMPAEEYHAVPAMSSSALKALAKSPFHYWAEYRAPNRPARKTTDGMKAGTLCHTAVLEPATLAARYAVKPEGMDGRTKEGKAWAAEHADRIVISSEQHTTATAQRDAVLAVPELASLLQTGYAESSVFWIDDETGVFCKARPDWVHPLPDGRVILLDLKSTVDPAPQAFGRTVFTFGYHRQEAHYSRGFTAATGLEVAAFVFGAVSAEYPFVAVPYMLDDESRLMGYADRHRLMATYAECDRSGMWPAFGSGVQLVSLPAWAK